MSNRKEINRQSRRKAIFTLGAIAGTSTLGVVGNNLYSKNEDQILNKENLPLFSIRDMKSGQLTTFNNKTKQKAFPIQPGEKKILVQHDSPGIITRIWMTTSGWFWENWDVREEKWPDTTILKKLILRIYWDDNKFPSVEAPIGDFFGVGHCEYKHFVSKYLGMSSGGFYCYFPMPFNKVKIEVENLHDKSIPHVFLNANYTSYDVLPSDAGRFHCMYNSGTNAGSEPQYIMKTKGKGHFVGCCLSMQSWLPNYLGYLEAPEYIFIDDDFEEKNPSIVGTGLEDYFNGGWYFRDGEFNAPLHGVPLKDPLRSMISMYRFHESDAICFDKSFTMLFQSPRPPEHTREFKFSSTAYWYQQSASELLYKLPSKDKLVDLYRIRDTDHQSIP
ncbi:MAG: DUF2961 domain-containing protein [Fermentimonas sp.]|jgi:hypothetical protein|nr:DUF2961 domain-containing protein [Fermentimonas sp.]